MCKTPNKLADGSLVACRKCWQCRSNRIDEWVGRCIAESKTAVATTSLTLTYGRDDDGNVSHARAAVLTYSDVQKYFKQLRKRGYPARYLMTGEVGEKGRCHWHGVVFWTKKLPEHMTDFGGNSWHRARRKVPVTVPIVWDQRFNEPCWPHGFSHWAPVRQGHEKGSIAYACKYITKEVGDPAAQSKLAMSKNPPIGSEYFIGRAQKFVDERISPQDAFYAFPALAKRKKSGEVINFQLRGKVKQLFCQAFIDKWNEQVGGPYPPSEFLAEYEDRKTREEGDYIYLGRQTWERVPDIGVKLKPRKWPFDPPPGYSNADINWDVFIDFPYVKTSTEWLWYGPNKEGKKLWQNVEPEPDQSAERRHINEMRLLEPFSLPRPLPVSVWLKGHSLLGHWSLSKVKIDGRHQWLQSLMPRKKRRGRPSTD